MFMITQTVAMANDLMSQISTENRKLLLPLVKPLVLYTKASLTNSVSTDIFCHLKKTLKLNCPHKQ